MQTEEELDPELFTKEGKLRKRKKKQQSQDYFTQDTEDAIIEYVNSTDSFERDRIFSSRIYKAFDKLAECNINGNNFPYAQDHAGGYEDLKHETIYKLIKCMPNFNKVKGMKISEERSSTAYTKGTLGYGYFNRITKNFLIQYNDKHYKLAKNRKNLESEEVLDKVDLMVQEDDDNTSFQEFVQSFADFIEENIDDYFYLPDEDVDDDGNIIDTEISLKLTKTEKSIARVLIDFIRDVDNIELIPWKQAIYFTIKELTKQKTADITRVVNILKYEFEVQRYEYNHRGELNTRKKKLF